MTFPTWAYHVTFWTCSVYVLWSCLSGWVWMALGTCMLLAIFYWLTLDHVTPALQDPQGRWILITGCDTGFGHGLARKLSHMGADVIAACYDVKGEGARELQELERDNLHVVSLDVTSDVAVEECCQQVAKLCGDKGLWGLVNNAGITDVVLIEFSTVDLFRSELEINFLGAVRMTKALLPLVRKARGRVVNVSSVHGRIGMSELAAYEASKFALEAFSDVLRLEMTHFGVKVAIVEPGHFGTGTGVTSAPAAVERRIQYFTALEPTVTQDLHDTYGEDYCRKMMPKVEEASQRFASRHQTDISPVIRALTHALLSPSPRIRYLVAGTSPKYVDGYPILVRLNSYLPTWLMDHLVRYWRPPPRPART